MDKKSNVRLNYEATHKRIEKVIQKMVDEGDALTVSNVAKRAGICLATAYNHKVREMLLEIIKKS